MYLHSTVYEGKHAFLFLDEDERVIELPTEFFRSLVRSPRKLAEGTLARYSERIRDLCNFLEQHEVYGNFLLDDAIKNLKRTALQAFYSSLQANGLGDSTVRGAESAVRKFAAWLNTDEANYIHSKSLYPDKGGAMTPSPAKRQPRYLTSAEVISLVKSQHFEAQRAVVHFMYDTGVRISEIPRVLERDLPDPRHYPDGQMYFPLLVRGSKGRGGKLKERYTIISRPVLSRLARHHNTKEFLFNFDYEDGHKPALLNVFGEKWTTDAIEALIRRGRDRSGLAAASAHRLRHGTAFSVLKSEHGKSLLDNLIVVQKMLGHTHIETTEIYTSIPAPVLQQLRNSFGTPEFQNRYEEAQSILDATFMPSKNEPIKRRIGVSK